MNAPEALPLEDSIELYRRSLREPTPPALAPLAKAKDGLKKTKHLSQSLLTAKIPRFEFDPANPDDRLVYLVFMRTGKWIRQYYFHFPDLTVVNMINRKLIEHALSGEEAAAGPIIEDLNAAKLAADPADRVPALA